ncbi:MAG: hypothetical protein LBI61_01945 [Puniceicoccales bacterium]|jgi:hypothetical protein|nr:hypothetical protein [Puniceicoccales bacterium]
MHIGLKDGKIVVFSETLEELEINAAVKGIVPDAVEETEEEIVPYYNTANDGIYYKISEVPLTPPGIANAALREKRRELYRLQSDPLTNKISVLRDRIERGDYESPEELAAIEARIPELYAQRKAIREQIISENQFVAP